MGDPYETYVSTVGGRVSLRSTHSTGSDECVALAIGSNLIRAYPGSNEDVDGRDKPGHDEEASRPPM
jgi:hypothetical protein